MIRYKKFVTTKKLKKEKLPQGKPVHINWLEPCTTVHSSKLKPAPMSNKVRKIVEQRILTNLAISRARASVRAAKREEARIETERAKAELEQKTTLSELHNPRSSKGSRRPPNPVVIYRKYLDRCKAASQAKVRRFDQESTSQNLTSVQHFPAAESGPESESCHPSIISAMCRHSLKYQDTAAWKIAAGNITFNESLPDPSNEFHSSDPTKNTLRTKGQSKEIQKSLNKDQESDENEGHNLFDQPGTSKESAPNSEHMFKKPFPVKPKASGHKTAVQEVRKKKVKIRSRRYQVIEKMNVIQRKYPLLKCLHPSDISNQKKNAVRISKLLLEKGHMQKKKHNIKKGQTGKTVDLFKILHDIVQFICDQVSYILYL
jgi:hypothetical protein